MSNEKQRLFRPGNRPELTAERVGRHRGDSLAFIQRVRRRARKQSERCLAGIRDDARFFMRWIADTRTLRVAWDHQAQYGGQVPALTISATATFPKRRSGRTSVKSVIRSEMDCMNPLPTVSWRFPRDRGVALAPCHFLAFMIG